MKNTRNSMNIVSVNESRKAVMASFSSIDTMTTTAGNSSMKSISRVKNIE
jgi:hypothetical protein